MKKFTALIFAIVSILTFALSACGSEDSCEHMWRIVKATATCEEDGETTFWCSLCGETKIEITTATGHVFNKNVCENCDYTQTDLSELTSTQRMTYVEELIALAPYLTDSETLEYSHELLSLQQEICEDCEEAVTAAEENLEKVENNRTIRTLDGETGQWIYIADPSKVAAAEKKLAEAETDLLEAKQELETYKENFIFNFTGYAWQVTINFFENNEEFSNDSLQFNFATMLALYNSALEINYIAPTWYKTLQSTIKDITGISAF